MIPRSLRARVTMVGVVTLALMLSTGGWLTVRALAAALRSDTRAQNEEVLDELAAQIIEGANARLIPVPIGADGTEFLILDEAGRVVNVSFIAGEVTSVPLFPGTVIVDAGPLVFGSEQELIDFLESQGGDVAFLAQQPLGETVFSNTNDWFETRRSVRAPDGEELTLVALSPFGVISRSIDRLALALALIVPVIVALGGFSLWVAIGAALRPVKQISSEAKRIAPFNSGDRLPVPESADEIADLAVTLNGMLDRLDAGLNRQRQFVSDASHELRSPLTTVKGATELVAGNEDLPRDVASPIEALVRGVDRLETVLDDLTDLAAAGVGTDPVEVELADLVEAEVESVASRSEVSIDTTGVSPAVVKAHRVRLGRAVHNLLDNAVRHADAVVVITTCVDDDGVVITIDDDGPGIPKDQRERVFERFVRLDDARTRARGGSGLGLALVASIADDHGGTVVCSQSPAGGARFVLSF